MRIRFTATLLALILLPACASTEPTSSVVVTDDIDRFWETYDRVTALTDSAEQVRQLEALYIQRGTPGLEAMIARRGYTAADYVSAIQSYPRFWEAMRPRMERADDSADEIADGIEGFRDLYPALRPARVYFTVGALQTPGMTLEDIVFIGSELALADADVPTDEFPESFGHLSGYFATEPAEAIAFLNVHEYVHTQQGPFGSDLLTMALQEGVAEFVADLATPEPTPTPAIAYGKANETRVREAFKRDMFGSFVDFWLWSNRPNEFETRDLGYSIGYEIAERVHAQADDKTQAIADLIELDYQDPAAVDALVEASGYFERPVSELRAEAPRVVRVEGLEGDELAPGRHTLTFVFSQPMDPAFRSFDYGPLGEDHVLGISEVVGLSDDGRRLTVVVDLAPNHRHQMTVTSGFRSVDGVRLVPHLVDVRTRDAE
ncbi:MAG: hypothetical protein Rubg2KO_11410 [Rubricoccaceae bacterium]